MATRRAVLNQIALGLGVVACRGVIAQPAEQAGYVGIETSAFTGHSQARFISNSGATTAVTRLDFRAHGMAQAGNTLIVFPRRPGTRFAIIDTGTLEIRKVVDAPDETHFYGHGAFTRDGQTLLVTENDLTTLSGRIALYEGRSGKRRGHVGLPGSGPHEIIRAPDRDVFYVALGGLETHPAYGREPLNTSTFRSQLVRLDLTRGTVEEMAFWPGTEGISLRHLAIDGSGRVYIGGQLEDPQRGADASVLWQLKDGQPVRIDDDGALAGYVSSVASSDTHAWVTSKKSHCALQLENGRVVDRRHIEGASAVAEGQGLTALSGYAVLNVNKSEILATPHHEWDNHGFAVAAFA